MPRAFSMFALCVLVLVCSTVVQAQYTPAALADQIHDLPGIETQPSFNHFAGYLTVDVPSNRSLFYWYTEAQTNPSTAPLFWWSNGGPGCSGLLGFFTEHGPFRITGDATYPLVPNPFAWNTLANTLYIEAPAGVGFSFSNNKNDYNTDDAKTASDNYLAIVQFFLRFPHLQSNDFYVSAESYGGHYVPTLTQYILNMNASPTAPMHFTNFKGFLLGNPLIDPVENQVYGSAGTICGHSLASKATCDAYTAACIPTQGANCDQAVSNVQAESGMQGDGGVIDPYGVDFPVCNSNGEKIRTLQHIHSTRKNQKWYNPFLKAQLETIPMPYDPCQFTLGGNGGELTVYLSRADVLETLRISPQAFPWSGCSGNINYNQEDGNNPMEPVISDIISRGLNLRLVVYSGDDDTVCGTIGTQYWINNLLKPLNAWTPWQYADEEYGTQVSGYAQEFAGLGFVTVHGAGHQVPQFEPQRGLALLQGFLAGSFTPSQHATEKIRREADQTKNGHHHHHQKKPIATITHDHHVDATKISRHAKKPNKIVFFPRK